MIAPSIAATPPPQTSSQSPQTGWPVGFIEVKVIGSADLPRHEGKTVFLREIGRASSGDRILPMVVGPAEAYAIDSELDRRSFPRPLSHDLLMSITQAFGCAIEQVAIVRLEEGTFHAQLSLRTVSGELQVIDARPSDSIVLALKAKASIFVDESVMAEASIRQGQQQDRSILVRRVGSAPPAIHPDPNEVRDAVESLTKSVSPPAEARGNQLDILMREMESAVAAEDFERAAQVRNRIHKLQTEGE